MREVRDGDQGRDRAAYVKGSMVLEADVGVGRCECG